MTQAQPPSATWLVLAGAVGFLAGGLVMALLLGFVLEPADLARLTRDDSAPAREDRSLPAEVHPAPLDEPAPVARPPVRGPATVPTMGADPLADLRSRRLEVPVWDVSRAEIQDTFDDRRGGSGRHEAVDILAPRDTPVLAVEDGSVARLFTSEAGGITVYQFDPTMTYVYYYAHLERYAEGLIEGAAVARGQVLGYVGTTGNAPRDTPHLHFAIFKMTDEKRWWQGTPIDPFQVLR